MVGTAGEWSSPRTRKLFQDVRSAPMELTAARATIFTRAFDVHSHESLIVRRALAYRAVLAEAPIRIHDGEILVGGLTERRRGALLFPEIIASAVRLDTAARRWAKRFLAPIVKGGARLAGVFHAPTKAKSSLVDLLLEDKFDGVECRRSQRFAVTDDDRAAFRRLLARWRTRDAYTRYRRSLTPRERKLQGQFVYTADPQFFVSLYHPSYRLVLDRGLKAFIDEANERADSARDAVERDFFRARAVAAEGLLVYTGRYADEARRLASATTDAARRGDLEEIATVLDRVPAMPPRDFREALQAYWLLFLGLVFADGSSECVFARMDHVLGDFLRRDLASGHLTAAAARELVEIFVVKSNELVFALGNGGSIWEDGNTGRLTLTLGGVDARGEDVTNELTHLFLDVISGKPVLQPNLAVRLHRQSPPELIQKAMALTIGGGNNIQLFSDESIIPSLEGRGEPRDAARNYIIAGCVQPGAEGTFGSLCAAFLNLPRSLEIFLADIRKAPKTFDELHRAYIQFVRAVLAQVVGSLEKVDKTQRDLLPDAVVSLYFDGPAVAGREVTAGSARGNMTGVSVIGLGTVADSLAAIRAAVYEKMRFTFAALKRLLSANFERAEADRQWLLNAVPKYGNDEDGVDNIAVGLVEGLAAELAAHRTVRGGVYNLGLHSEAGHVAFGYSVGATPDGRLAGQPLSVGAGTGSGRDRSGVTAALRSFAKLPSPLTAGGTSANLRFHPSTFDGAESVDRFRDLALTYLQDLGGMQLQVNVVSAETLRAAQARPEEHGDLMVRIAGYSARFVDLTRNTQDEIISRTEHGQAA